MTSVRIENVVLQDGVSLIEANKANMNFHRPWSEPFTDEEGFGGWFSRIDGERNVSLIARSNEDNGIVGVFNFTEIVRGVFQSCYVGFYGMKPYCGRGLMTAALKLAVRYVFSDLDLHRIEANIRPENMRSIALVQRCGFKKEGYSPNYLYLDGAWRDHERWAITTEDLNP